ncbi:MAG TPA: NHL repeat-containing protein, partial [Candidatus Paceibacterota bacterium]|nr:NHL repeat-containing protein [Candidatus Paceibacterota bacterium]
MPPFALALLFLAAVLSIHAVALTTTPLGAVSWQLHGPARVAADAAGNLYVTDPAAGRVVVFDAFGQPRAVRDGFAGPLAIAIASDGRIYLSEEQNGSVSVFDAQWNRLYQLGGGTNEFQLPGNLAVDPRAADTVYVADGAANLVRVFTGAVQTSQFGGAGTGDGQF